MKMTLPRRTVFAAMAMMLFLPDYAPAQSLKAIEVPEPPMLWKFVRNKEVAIQLGKALFWDMQLGSDGMTACATCHFHAGTDDRTRNSLNPGTNGGDTLFHTGNGPNSEVAKPSFPFVKFIDPEQPDLGMLSESNDIIGSQGVPMMNFVDIVIGSAEDLGTPVVDPVFQLGGNNVRQVTGRNAPSVINAVYNFTNGWSGHANNVFNGGSTFGAMDNGAKVYVKKVTGLTEKNVRIRNGALASFSMGPPVNSVEMSWNGRTWPKIGKKMLSLRPLGQQVVHPQDSVLGPISKSGFRPNGSLRNVPGIGRTYSYLIRKAFMAKYWKDTAEHLEFVDPLNPDLGLQIVAGAADPIDTDQFSQMEANFDFFFGLAVQTYLSTLVSDQSPFDKYSEEILTLGFSNTLTAEQQVGLANFNGIGGCAACHGGPEFTLATVGAALPDPNPPLPGIPPTPPDPRKNPLGAIEFVAFTVGDALYDKEFRVVTVTRQEDDPGRSDTAPFINPLTSQPYPLGFSELALLKRDNLLPASVANYTPSLPVGFRSSDTAPGTDRVASVGAFKAPSLRNISLTGPYFHNGSMVSLMQVIDFYSRGGNFSVESEVDKPLEISPIIGLRGNDVQQRALIAFLQSLTDPRVEEESGPFDHPQLIIPHGVDGLGNEILEELPAVGKLGRLYELEQKILPFLNVNHMTPNG